MFPGGGLVADSRIQGLPVLQWSGKVDTEADCGSKRDTEREERMRQKLSCLCYTESSADAMEELQPGHYPSSAWLVFPMPSFCVPVCSRATFCCRSCWGFTTARSARGSSDSPAEGSSWLAVCCACRGPETTAPEAQRTSSATAAWVAWCNRQWGIRVGRKDRKTVLSGRRSWAGRPCAGKRAGVRAAMFLRSTGDNWSAIIYLNSFKQANKKPLFRLFHLPLGW